jgi:hypothetical protein
VRIIAQAVKRESEIKLTFRLNVVGKTPNRGEECLSLREWREVELPILENKPIMARIVEWINAFCSMTCNTTRVHDIRLAQQGQRFSRRRS